ncbi:MAG: hypothetical protein AAFU80_12410 [Pseudomonadota bacterium]
MALDFSHLLVALVAGSAGALWMWGRRRQEAGSTQHYAMPQTRKSTDETSYEDKMGLGEQVFTIMFLGGWLIAWSFGVLVVLGTLLSGESEGGMFLFGWLIAAIAGWFAAVYTLLQALKGRRSTFLQRR